MTKLFAITVILLSVVVLEGCGSAQAVKPEDVTVGNTIPDFSVTSLEGNHRQEFAEGSGRRAELLGVVVHSVHV